MCKSVWFEIHSGGKSCLVDRLVLVLLQNVLLFDVASETRILDHGNF